MRQFGLFINRDKINSIEKSSYNIIDKYFLNEPESPHFFIHRVAYTGHTENNEGMSIDGRLSFSEKYRHAYLLEIDALRYVVSVILKKDPNAVIILCGDHGAHKYWMSSKNIDELKKELKLNNISYLKFLEDHFKVFAAIRIPKKFKQVRRNFSPANVFPIIFDSIGYSGQHIDIPENNSYFKGYIKGPHPVIRNGTIIDVDDLVD